VEESVGRPIAVELEVVPSQIFRTALPSNN
jgi:hypothetical protein